MEEIKVGEYVRTKQGYIAKIIRTTDEFIHFDNTIHNSYEESVLLHLTDKYGKYDQRQDIVSHSFSIIDLIQVGDYVNGMRIFTTYNRINDNGEKVVLAENYNEWTDDGVISNNDIKSIVTKEQFKSIEYEV